MDANPLEKGFHKVGSVQVTPAELLVQEKQRLHEASLHMGRMVALGTLSGGKDGDLWTGAISLQKRVVSHELTMDQVQGQAAKLGEYFVATKHGASIRCIDGSTLLYYDDTDPRWFSRGLGPQVQGGTLGEAVAWRMWQGIPESEQVSLAADMRSVAEMPSDYEAGGHTDDHANADTDEHAEKSGCGQYDGQPRRLPLFNQKRPSALMVTVAATILEFAHIQTKLDDYDQLSSSAGVLLKRPDYFLGAGQAVAALQDLNPLGLEKVVRPHNEVSLTINFVPGTTFHRDHYNAATGGKIQNFGLDAWYIIEKFGAAGYALVVDAVATAMDLTDGSLLLFARLPNEK